MCLLLSCFGPSVRVAPAPGPTYPGQVMLAMCQVVERDKQPKTALAPFVPGDLPAGQRRVMLRVLDHLAMTYNIAGSQGLSRERLERLERIARYVVTPVVAAVADGHEVNLHNAQRLLERLRSLV